MSEKVLSAHLEFKELKVTSSDILFRPSEAPKHTIYWDTKQKKSISHLEKLKPETEVFLLGKKWQLMDYDNKCWTIVQLIIWSTKKTTHSTFGAATVRQLIDFCCQLFW